MVAADPWCGDTKTFSAMSRFGRPAVSLNRQRAPMKRQAPTYGLRGPPWRTLAWRHHGFGHCETTFGVRREFTIARGLCLLAKALKNRATTIGKKRREIETTTVRPFFVIVCGPLSRPFDNFAERCFCLGVWPRWRAHTSAALRFGNHNGLGHFRHHSASTAKPVPWPHWGQSRGRRESFKENHRTSTREVPSHPAGRPGRREKRAVAREGRLIRGPSWQCRA
jgi:hypothetical protein